MFGLFFATFIFVLCGFEHCVANAFYFSLAGMVNGSAVVYLVKNAVFNAVGGIAAYRLISLK
jgi:formate/nitrite transporter FocA (FNT family)